MYKYFCLSFFLLFGKEKGSGRSISPAFLFGYRKAEKKAEFRFITSTKTSICRATYIERRTAKTIQVFRMWVWAQPTNQNLQALKGVMIMLKLFKKSIWIPYEDSTVYPTVAKAQQAIIKYCEDNGFLYEFTADDEVVIDGIKHEIYRGYESGSRGNYGIKCREK